MIMGAAYLTLLFTGIFLGQAHPDAGMSDLNSVMALFSHPVGTLDRPGRISWSMICLSVHGIVRDAKRNDMSHLSTLPALIFSLMFGPIGLGIYLNSTQIQV